MTSFFILAVIGIGIISLPIMAVYWLFRFVGARWTKTASHEYGKRVGILLMGAVIASSPYLAYKAYNLYQVLARVPAPLHVSWIEFRSEEAWGIGGPGDNATGFVVYRLTASSAAWARAQGNQLGNRLSNDRATWLPTPMIDNCVADLWGHCSNGATKPGAALNLGDLLDRFGYSIPVDPNRAAEFDDAIRKPGSVYGYTRGRSITVVDPVRGKVYFAYAD